MNQPLNFYRSSNINRRKFITNCFAAGSLTLLGLKLGKPTKFINTVQGEIKTDDLGLTLSHEHILVEFIGAKDYDPSRWDQGKVIQSLLPELQKLKQLGVDTLFDFTPAYLGRDVLLLKELSTKSGLNIITNTGFYGAVNNKYLPEIAFKATADDLANIWIKEFQNGIENTPVKPGFIKISVNPDNLSDLHKKLITAAAITHLQTGLTIASHTGPAVPAFEQITVLKQSGVHPSAFVWVHAQNEDDRENYLKAAEMGAWVSLDGIQEDNIKQYIDRLGYIKENGLLKKVLISQDAGWYEPGKPWQGLKRSYTDIVQKMVPQLKSNGFTNKEVRQLLEINPAEAFAIHVRRT